MSLGARFVRHLREPRGAGAHEFAHELAVAGLDLESRCFAAWIDRAESIDDDGSRVAIATRPPENACPGDRWFDPCELVVMLRGVRSWIATRPTARWQMHAMLEVSTITPREVQVVPPYAPLDPARLTPQGADERGRCTNLTAGEATFYAWFFNKCLPHRYDWQFAEEKLPGLMRRLWRDSALEWVAGQHNEDEGSRLIITPETIDSEPEDDARIVRGEYTRDAQIGFRTAVLLQIGLIETLSSPHFLPEPVRLDSFVGRDAFR